MPLALFITCSDSRVNPNLITQTEPGKLFTPHNAGNIVSAYGAAAGGEAATIEFAVSELRVKDVIVCGHSRCGAMQALLHLQRVEHLPALRQWLTHAGATRRTMCEKYVDRTGDAALTTAIEENVLVQLENLRTPPSVASGLARGDLKLHGWVYSIETGEVFAYQPEQGQFVPIEGGAVVPLPTGAPGERAPPI